MKNQILDELTRDSFSDFLEKGETILWEASARKSGYSITPTNTDTKPKKEQSIIKTLILDFLFELLFSVLGPIFLFIIYLILSPFLEEIGFWILGLATFLIVFIFNRLKKKPAEYAITNKRILFKSIQSKKIKIYEIPFSEINDCVVVKNKNKRGTIFLAVKNPEAIPFDTFTILDTNETAKQHQPTLENLKEVDKVAQFIRQGIQQNN